LLNTEGVLRDVPDSHIFNGVNLYGYPTDCPSLWEPCAEGTYREKDEGGEWPLPRFDSFVVYQAVTCSTLSVGGDPGDFAGRVERVLDATISAGVEQALAAGVTGSSNPFFGDANVDILNSGTAVTPRIGISFLEQAIGETCRLGMIHATPAVIAGLPAPIGPRNDMLTTGNDTPLVSGMGYQDVDTPYLSTPDTTEDWVFATGPVNVYLGAVRTEPIRTSLERDTNIVTFRAERYVLAVWDTALQAAVLVDWSS
jgi:hypothetical protein